MAMQQNSVNAIGNLCDNPSEPRPAGQTVVMDFRLAINDGWGDRKKTVYIDVVVFGKAAEACFQHLTKGKQVSVSGRLEEDTWEDKKTGNRRSKIKIVAHHVGFGDKADGQKAEKPSSGNRGRGQSKPPQKTLGEYGLDNDIAF